MDSQVLVVGAGPVGLMAGIQLARRGVPTRIIEKKAEPSMHSKALAVFARTLEALERLGLAERFVECGRALHGAVLHSNGRELGRLTTDELDSPFNYILCIPQSQTERLLEDEAHRLGVVIDRGTDVVDVRHGSESVQVKVRCADGAAETIDTPWLIACDGAHSTVRHRVGLSYEGEDIDRWFIFADAIMDSPLPSDRLNAFFDPAGVAIAIPMPEPGLWRVILSMPEDKHPPDDPALELIESMFRRRSGLDVHLRDAQWTTRFTIRQRMVQQFRAQRIFLAGDAAHSHSPAGGQGMNTGLQDAENLAWKLALVIHGRADASLLETYELERKPVAQTLLRTTGAMTKVATLTGSLPQAVRNHMVHWALQLGFIERRAMRILSELDVGYRSSPLSINEPPRRGLAQMLGDRPLAGQRAPVVSLRDDGGRDVHLPSLIAGEALLVLVFDGGNAGDSIAQVQRWIDEQAPLPMQMRVIVQRDRDANGYDHIPALVDDDGAARARYDVDGTCMFALRPDGVIGLRADACSADVLRRWVQRLHSARA